MATQSQANGRRWSGSPIVAAGGATEKDVASGEQTKDRAWIDTVTLAVGTKQTCHRIWDGDCSARAVHQSHPRPQSPGSRQKVGGSHGRGASSSLKIRKTCAASCAISRPLILMDIQLPVIGWRGNAAFKADPALK